MSNKEIKQLIDLAKELKKNVTKEIALDSFVSAGIMNKKGEFTKPYKSLNEVFVKTKH